jgi:hypothetical protein
MLGQSRIAIAAATVIAVGVGLMPAHSQSPKTPRPVTEPPLEHPIDFYRDLISKGAKLAVHDDSAKTEIVKVRPPAGEGRIVISEAPPYQPYACGYVTKSRNGNRQRFIYYFNSDRTVLFASLEDKALVDAMASCDFLPRSPPPD